MTPHMTTWYPDKERPGGYDPEVDAVRRAARQRRDVLVVFTRATAMTIQFMPGDVTYLTGEEYERVVAVGVAVPGELVDPAPPKPRSRRKKKGAKA
jgi:hypothetical protein